MGIPHVPPPPLPPELMRWTIRTPAVDDIDRMLALAVAIERSVLGATITTRAEIAQDLSGGAGQGDTARLFVEHEGELIAALWLLQVHENQFMGDVQIHPSVPRDAGDRIMAWGLNWFERIARAVEPAPDRVQLGNWCFEADAERARRLDGNGYEQARAFLRMTRDVAADEAFPAPGPEVVIRPARIRADDPSFGDARVVHELITHSFADHYNYSATPFERWFARRTEDAGFDPQQWWLAELDGRPLGAMIMDNSLADDGAGYVHYVGVERAARGRGLAKALLYKGFAVSRDLGYRTVKLFVDAESPTGATQLYESIGMTRELVTYDWQKWLTLG